MFSHSTSNFNRGHVGSIQQMFKVESICMVTGQEISSPFVCQLIDNNLLSLLYNRLDHTQRMLQLFLQMFQKSFKVVLICLFAKHDLVTFLSVTKKIVAGPTEPPSPFGRGTGVQLGRRQFFFGRGPCLLQEHPRWKFRPRQTKKSKVRGV